MSTLHIKNQLSTLALNFNQHKLIVYKYFIYKCINADVMNDCIPFLGIPPTLFGAVPEVSNG